MAAGKVIGTNPPAGTEVARTHRDAARVEGSLDRSDPEREGPDPARRWRALTDAGFVVADVQNQASADVPKGRAVGTTPTGSAPTRMLTLLIWPGHNGRGAVREGSVRGGGHLGHPGQGPRRERDPEDGVVG